MLNRHGKEVIAGLILFVLIIGIVIGFLIFNKLTGNVSLVKEINCEISFEDKNLDSWLAEKVNSNEQCRNLIKNKKAINDEVCRKTKTLGRINVKLDNYIIDSFDIECDESLVQEGIPITFTGNLTVLYIDDFKNMNATLVYKIRENNKDYELKFERDIGRVKEVVKADYVAVSVVGIDVSHFHVHLVPRYLNDGMANFWPTKKYKDGESEELAEKIRKGK